MVKDGVGKRSGAEGGDVSMQTVAEGSDGNIHFFFSYGYQKWSNVQFAFNQLVLLLWIQSLDM